MEVLRLGQFESEFHDVFDRANEAMYPGRGAGGRKK